MKKILYNILNPIWRLNRLLFFYYLITAIGIYAILALFEINYQSSLEDVYKSLYIHVIRIPIGFVIPYVFIVGHIKRFHDLNKSWWYILLYLIPFINVGMLIYLLFFPWTKWENKYGLPN